jgi:K+-transporting ATPase ATPase A chain
VSGANWLQLAVLVGAVLVTTPLLGAYLARVLGGGSAPGDRFFGPLERMIYRAAGVDARREQPWNVYAISLLAFSVVSVIGLFVLQRVQGVLPLDPTNVDGVPAALAFNTAASFVTNTNWQNYGGESTMSHLTQMAGLAVQNFVSAAVGIAVAIALVRGLTRRRSAAIGNFWVDLTRVTVRVLLPLATVLALLLASQGVVQSLRGPAEAQTVEGAAQSIYRAPVASQEAIKELGTNGGGIANANSAHPFENPTAFTNLLENWALLAIPFALAYAFGRLVGDRRQGWALFAAMFVLWIASAGLAMGFELDGNPRVDASAPNLEGKEVRFGAAASGLFASSTTGTSTGGGDRLARQLYTARRGGAAREHDAGGGLPGWRGRRSLRDARVRAAGRLHRRVDGRADARVPGEEDPGGGDEARRAVPARRADAYPPFASVRCC